MAWILFKGMYKDLNINIVCPGKDSALGMLCSISLMVTVTTFECLEFVAVLSLFGFDSIQGLIVYARFLHLS